MVTITEEPEEPRNQQSELPKPRQKIPPQEPSQSQSPSSLHPFSFWCYFALPIAVIALFFLPFNSQDPKSWFLSLPGDLRHHYSLGRTIKVQVNPNSAPVEVFAIENGPIEAETVLLLHGLGSSSYAFKSVIDSLGSKGVRAVAVDLPGNGFSDRTAEVEEDVETGALERFRDVFSEIRNKGIFFAFDQLVETGQMPYQELQNPRFSRRKVLKVVEIGSEEIGRVLTQVIDAMGLNHIHLVLHDSSLASTAYWILNNVASLRSLTLLDTSTKPALPLWILQVNGILRIPKFFKRAIGFSCVKGNGGRFDLEAHRLLLKGRDSGRAVLEMGRRLNYSFSVQEWGRSDELRNLPMQLLWSSGCSEEYSEEGRRIAAAVPRAKFVEHSGGRWPQEDSTDELVENIFGLVSSLTESIRHTKEDDSSSTSSSLEHVHKISDEETGDDRLHGHGYANAYGLDHGWAA